MLLRCGKRAGRKTRMHGPCGLKSSPKNFWRSACKGSMRASCFESCWMSRWLAPPLVCVLVATWTINCGEVARATPQITKFCLMRFVNCWAGSVPLRPGLMDVLRVLMTCYSFLWLAWLKGRTKTGMVCLTAWSKASPKPSAKVGAARPGKTTGPEPQTWGQIAQASQRFPSRNGPKPLGNSTSLQARGSNHLVGKGA